MAIVDIKPELEKFLADISTKNTYYGTKVSESMLALLVIEMRENGGGILAPYWFSVTQKGRGPRKSTKDSGLWQRIYKWMEKHGMFTADSEAGKIREAKAVTWYINKYGDQHFRSKEFVDIYESARQECIRAIDQKYDIALLKITFDIL